LNNLIFKSIKEFCVEILHKYTDVIIEQSMKFFDLFDNIL